MFPSPVGVSVSSFLSGSVKDALSAVVSLLPFAASLSWASCGTLLQASFALEGGLGLVGGVIACKSFAAVVLGLDSGVSEVCLSVEQDLSSLTPVLGILFSTPGFETQRERGVSSASVSPFTTAELVLAKGALKTLELPRSVLVSSFKFRGLLSVWVLSPRGRGSSDPTGVGLRNRGGLGLDVDPSDSSVLKEVASAVVDCFKVDSVFRGPTEDLELFVKARGRSCWSLDGEPMSVSPSSKMDPCDSAPSSAGMSSSGGICPPRCKRI